MKNHFFNKILGFSPHWNYKNIASYDREYFSEKNKDLSIIDKIHLKCNCSDVSVLNGVRQPIIYSFVLEKPPGFKVFCEPETTHFEKINKSVLNTVTFHLEDDNQEEVDFSGETLTITLQMIKNQYFKSVFIYLKTIVIVFVIDIDLLQ